MLEWAVDFGDRSVYAVWDALLITIATEALCFITSAVLAFRESEISPSTSSGEIYPTAQATENNLQQWEENRSLCSS